MESNLNLCTRNRGVSALDETALSVLCRPICGDWTWWPCPSKLLPPHIRKLHLWRVTTREGTSIKKKASHPLGLDIFAFCSWIKEVCNLHFKRSWSKQLPSSFCIFLTTNESDYRPWWAPASYGLVALTIFEVSCSNFIRRILSRISGACWKLLMTDVSPHCHTPCIIWFGKQHTVFCSISMSQTVCKQLVITQFSENHYFPMKCWTCSKLGFGMASAAPMMQCHPVLQVHIEEKRRGEESRWRGFLRALCLSALQPGRALTQEDEYWGSEYRIWTKRKLRLYYKLDAITLCTAVFLNSMCRTWSQWMISHIFINWLINVIGTLLLSLISWLHYHTGICNYKQIKRKSKQLVIKSHILYSTFTSSLHTATLLSYINHIDLAFSCALNLISF